jgi:hypothetical protein
MASPKTSWAVIIRQVQTPLGFYVLALLIVESALTITLGLIKDEQKLTVFAWIIIVFGMVIAIVTGLVIWDPRRLLYGKEEHANPTLEPSALRDQIEDLIQANVKRECLKNVQKG